MKRSKFIKKHILPHESSSEIIAYLDGSADYDDDYLKERSKCLNVKLNLDE